MHPRQSKNANKREANYTLTWFVAVAVAGSQIWNGDIIKALIVATLAGSTLILLQILSSLKEVVLFISVFLFSLAYSKGLHFLLKKANLHTDMIPWLALLIFIATSYLTFEVFVLKNNS